VNGFDRRVRWHANNAQYAFMAYNGRYMSLKSEGDLNPIYTWFRGPHESD